MHYKHHLFTRGVKHFNPYMKRVIHHKHAHHHSGGSIATDYQLLKMLGNMSVKPGLYKIKHPHYGGAITHNKPQRRTQNKALHFTR